MERLWSQPVDYYPFPAVAVTTVEDLLLKTFYLFTLLFVLVPYFR